MPHGASSSASGPATSVATEPLKILHVGKFLPPSFGGMERALDSMARGIATRGHQVRVLAHATDGTEDVGTVHEERLTIRREPYRFAVGTMPISMRFVATYRSWSGWADVVHFHEPFPTASVAFNLLPKPRRVVVSWHSDIVRQRLSRPIAEIFQRRLCARADRIICSTARVRDGSRVLGPWSKKCSIIGFGLDVSALREAAADEARLAEVRHRYGGRFALAVGRLVSYKGFDVLLRALAGNDLRVVIVGDGPMAATLKRLAADLGLQDRARFVGALGEADLWAHYGACEFLVLPSTTRAETFGIVQIEAMACGKPVINTALSTGVPEVSLNGITGLTVPPADAAALGEALVSLWRNPELVAKLGTCARERVDARYELNAVTRDLEALYRSVVRGDLAAGRPPSSTVSATAINDSAPMV